jgi:hypothetical protein
MNIGVGIVCNAFVFACNQPKNNGGDESDGGYAQPDGWMDGWMDRASGEWDEWRNSSM